VLPSANATLSGYGTSAAQGGNVLSGSGNGRYRRRKQRFSVLVAQATMDSMPMPRAAQAEASWSGRNRERREPGGSATAFAQGHPDQPVSRVLIYVRQRRDRRAAGGEGMGAW